MQRLNLLLALCTCVLAQFGLFANGIEVTNLQYGGEEDTGASITFTVGWENSWRLDAGPANYDAAYIFGKYRENSGPWQPMVFDELLNPDGGATLETAPNPSPGFFAYRDVVGTGNASFNLEVRWDYDAAGVDGAANVEVKIFAIEMVYVPEGAFDLGDGMVDRAQFYVGEGEFPSPPYSPFEVSSEGQIRIGLFDLFYNAFSSSSGDRTGVLPPAYPKGFAAFYCMKYEVSQQQWVDFFNTLTPAQQTTLDVTGANGKNSDAVVSRNAVAWDESNPATTSLPDVAMNYLSNENYLAYLDWAGLRPMTELEFEKASRGTAAPTAGEYAWGNTNLNTATYTLLGAGTPTEAVSNPGLNTGNAAYAALAPGSSPLRVGIFAANAANATRQETGGSYYGIMELSGNLLERAISVGHPSNRAFTGIVGDGILAPSGLGNTPNWPDDYLSYRGGGILAPAEYMEVSNRNFGSYTGALTLSANGFRGVINAQ